METQTNNLRRIKVLTTMFNLNEFYNIDLGLSGIRLQGNFNSAISRQAMKNKFKINPMSNSNGYMELVRNNVEIVLT